MDDKLAFIDSKFLEGSGFHLVREDRSGDRYVRGNISVLFEFPDEKISISINDCIINLSTIAKETLMSLLVDDSIGIKCPECGGEIKAYCDHEGIYDVAIAGEEIVLTYTGENPDYRGDPVFRCDDCGHKIKPEGKVIYV